MVLRITHIPENYFYDLRNIYSDFYITGNKNMVDLKHRSAGDSIYSLGNNYLDIFISTPCFFCVYLKVLLNFIQN